MSDHHGSLSQSNLLTDRMLFPFFPRESTGQALALRADKTFCFHIAHLLRDPFSSWHVCSCLLARRPTKRPTSTTCSKARPARAISTPPLDEKMPSVLLLVVCPSFWLGGKSSQDVLFCRLRRYATSTHSGAPLATRYYSPCSEAYSLSLCS